MSNAGSALMGMGQASGENKAIEAAKQAINSPLLELSIDGARGILFTITGGSGLGMSEVNEAAKVITASADEEAKIIFGAVIDPKLKDEIRITVVATGFNGPIGGERRKDANLMEHAYTPNVFIAEEEKREEKIMMDKKKNKISPLKAAQAEPAKKKSDADMDDEELDVPAFIRKKMM
jgi:cell division protein FtsZ